MHSKPRTGCWCGQGTVICMTAHRVFKRFAQFSRSTQEICCAQWLSLVLLCCFMTWLNILLTCNEMGCDTRECIVTYSGAVCLHKHNELCALDITQVLQTACSGYNTPVKLQFLWVLHKLRSHDLWFVLESDGGVSAVLTPRCASWAVLLCHTVKRHLPQHATVLATPGPADMWLLQDLHVSLQNSVPTHEAGSMLVQKLEKRSENSSVISCMSAQNPDSPARCLFCSYRQHDDMLASMLHSICKVSCNNKGQHTKQRQAATSVSNNLLSNTMVRNSGVFWGVCPPPLKDTTPKADPLAPPGTLAASAAACCSTLLAA